MYYDTLGFYIVLKGVGSGIPKWLLRYLSFQAPISAPYKGDSSLLASGLPSRHGVTSSYLPSGDLSPETPPSPSPHNPGDC